MKKAILTFLFIGILSTSIAQSHEIFEAHLQAGIEYFNNGNTKDALSSFKEAKRHVPNLDKEEEINAWIARCTTRAVTTSTTTNTSTSSATSKAPELHVDIEQFTFPKEGKQAFVPVSATHTWRISHQPDWCNCIPTNSHNLEIDCERNMTTMARTDSVVVTMGEISKVINIQQEAGWGQLFFQTTPENVNIRFLDSDRYIHPDSILYTLPPDTYRVEISKGGYAPIDTLVTIPEQASNKPTIVHVTLPPLFGTIKLNIKAQKGYSFSTWPTMRIGNKDIDISSIFYNQKLRSFNRHGSIDYYNLYEGNQIPVPCDSIHTITIKADGFLDYTTTCAVSKGNCYTLNAIMEPVSGILTITDQGNATGAKIIIDNIETEYTVPAHRLSLGIGKHWLKFKKENMISTQDSILVVIEEGKEITQKVSMNFFVNGKITSTPTGAQVFIDDKPIGFTQSTDNPLIIPLTEGTHKISIQKEGYQIIEEKVTISTKRHGEYHWDYNLQQTHPLHISADVENLYMTLKKDGEIIAKEALPADVNIPYGKYKIKLIRTNKKTAYKGTLKHTEKKDHQKILSYSRLNYYLLTGTYFITPVPTLSKLDGMDKSANLYNLLANASIGHIKVAPGLSTNVIKASMFTRNKGQFDQHVPTDRGYKEIYPNYLFGFSCLFINGDFRIGGALHQNFDINLLGSYTWMPNMKSFLPLSHASGHDVFAGIELSTRIPIFNVSLRAGWQMFKGEHNIYYKGEEMIEGVDFDKYHFYTAPMSTSQFVISVAIGLGEKDSKGSNILRVW